MKTPIVFFLLLLISATAPVKSVTLNSDIKALQAFKASIKPASIPPYSCLGSWNFTNDPCAIPRTHFTCGLLCYGDRVTHLTLDSAGYIGTLTPLVSKLTQLVSLDLANNRFRGPIPPLNSLINLQTLVLRSNSFSGAIPLSIVSLKALDTVDLSSNLLTGTLPPALGSMVGLRRLDLSFNKLTGALPRLPPNLIQLAAKGNSLSGSVSKPAFDGLTQLEVVEIGGNSLSGTLPAWFFLLPALQQVSFSNNSFTLVEIAKPKNSNSELIAVDLGYNAIEGLLPENFPAYPLLSSLSLRYNRLRGPIPGEYGKKETLKRLYLDGNFLNGSPPEGFFSGGGASVSGSLGDNCLQKCPVSSVLCLKSQKPSSICQHAYGGKPRS